MILAETRISLRVPATIPVKLGELAGGLTNMNGYLTTLIRRVHAGQATAGKLGESKIIATSVVHLSAKAKELDASEDRLCYQH